MGLFSKKNQQPAAAAAAPTPRGPGLSENEEITLGFTGVEGATQSFVHALISEAIRTFGPEVLDHIIFKGCNETVRGIINIVVDYMQES